MVPLQKDTKRIQKHVDKLLASRPTSSADVLRELAYAGADRAAAERVLAAVDWQRQANIVAQKEAEDKKATPDMIAAGLAGRGFSRAERIDALSRIDFVERGIEAAREAVESRHAGPAAVRNMLESDGYDPVSINTVMNRLGVRWDHRMDDFTMELLSEGLSRSEIDSILDNLGYSAGAVTRYFKKNRVDWSVQATERAIRMAVMGLPRERIEAALRDIGFSPVQSERAVKRVGFGTQALADRMARTYMENMAVSEQDMRERLDYAAFSSERIDKACRSVGADSVDWVAASAEPITKWLDSNPTLSRVEVTNTLREMGYSEKQIQNALKAADPDWKQRAHACAVSSWVGCNARAESKMHDILAIAGFTKSEIEYAIREFYHGESEEDCAFRDACDMGSLYMSKAAIERELANGGYSKSTIEKTSGRLFFDWDMHAVRYLRRMADRIIAQGLLADPAGMYQVMNGAGFTHEQAKSAIESIDFPWVSIAAEVIRQNVSKGGASYIEGILDERMYFDETKRIAKEMVDYDNINWDQRAQEMLSNLLAVPPLTPDEIVARMRERGHTEESIGYAIRNTLIPDDVSWTDRTIGYIRKLQYENHYSRRDLIARLKADGVGDERLKDVLSQMRFDWAYEAMQTAIELSSDPTNMPIEDIPAALSQRGFTCHQIDCAFAKLDFEDGRLVAFWDARRSEVMDRFEPDDE